MEFSIIEAIFMNVVPIEVLAVMLHISTLYQTCYTFTGDNIWKVLTADMTTDSIKMVVGKQDGLCYRATYMPNKMDVKLKVELLLEDGSVAELDTISVEFAKFLYYKMAFCLRGQSLLYWDGESDTSLHEKLPDNMVPDRLMLEILDSIFDNRDTVEVANASKLRLNSVRFGKYIDPDIQFGFIEAFREKKQFNVFYYDPKTTYYQSLWNSGVQSGRVMCTHLNVAIQIAYKWWKFSKSLVEVPEK